MCAICLEEGREHTAQHVHHIETFTQAATRSLRCAIAYDPDNLESLCESCHARLHNTKGAAAERAAKRTEAAAQAEGDTKGAEQAAKHTQAEGDTPQGGRGANFGARGAVNPAPVTHTQTVFSEVSQAHKKGNDRTDEDPTSAHTSTPTSAHNNKQPTRYTPPKGLLEATHTEIAQIADYLQAQDSLEAAHYPALSLLAKTLDRYNRANLIVCREGELVFSASGKPLRHPLLKVANDAQIQVLKLLAEFGLTPKSRERIKSLQQATDEDDPLAQFLKEK